MRLELSIGHAVFGVERDRKHRRIVLDSRFLQYSYRPERFVGKRERWCPEAKHLLRGSLSKHVERLLKIIPELLRRHECEEAMGVSMGRNFVPLTLDFLDQVGEALR